MSKKFTEEQFDTRDVMNTAQGRRFVQRLLEQLGYWGDMFDVDPYMHAKFSGARAVAVDLAGRLERDFPEQWLELLRERMARNNNTTRVQKDDDGQ